MVRFILRVSKVKRSHGPPKSQDGPPKVKMVLGLKGQMGLPEGPNGQMGLPEGLNGQMGLVKSVFWDVQKVTFSRKNTKNRD